MTTTDTDLGLREKALEVFDNLETIIKHERLQRVGYVSACEYNDRMTIETFESVPVCNGYKACLIGSCLIAAGAKVKRHKGDHGYVDAKLPFQAIDHNTQRTYAKRYRPELILVYDALNTVAERIIARNPQLHYEEGYSQPAERLFESKHAISTDKAAQLRFVRKARRLVEEAS